MYYVHMFVTYGSVLCMLYTSDELVYVCMYKYWMLTYHMKDYKQGAVLIIVTYVMPWVLLWCA